MTDMTNTREEKHMPENQVKLQCTAPTRAGVRCKNTKVVNSTVDPSTFTCHFHGGIETNVTNNTRKGVVNVTTLNDLLESKAVKTALDNNFRVIAAKDENDILYSGLTDGKLVPGSISGIFPVSLQIIRGPFVYLTLPHLPRSRDARSELFTWARKTPEVFDSKGKLRMLVTSNDSTMSWFKPLVDAGMIILESPKVMKRVSRFMAPRGAAGWFSCADKIQGMVGSFALTPHVVNNPSAFRTAAQLAEIAEFTDGMDNDEYLDFEVKSVDGAGFIVRSLWRSLVAGWVAQMVADEEPDWRITRMIDRFNKAEVVNLTVVDPNGSLKGNFRIVSDQFGLYMAEHLHIAPTAILTSLEGYKKGIATTNHRMYIAGEPQDWHDVARVDIQSYINLRPIQFPMGISTIIKDIKSKLITKIHNGTLVQSPKELIDIEERFLEESGEVMEEILGSWVAAEAVASGIDLRKMPSVLRQSAAGVMKGLATFEFDQFNKPIGIERFNIDIPCAWSMQKISETAARMMGWDLGHVERGTARVWWKAKMVVINDIDFFCNYRNHGGPDFDDFYVVMFRTIAETGERVLFLYRRPNGLGEYSYYRYVEGDKFPTYTWADKTKMTFPEVKLSDIVMPVTKAIELGITQDIDVPGGPIEAANAGAQAHYSGGAMTEDFRIHRLRQLEDREITAGHLVNAQMFWNHVVKDFPTWIISMEACVDLTTQDDMTTLLEKYLMMYGAILINEAPIKGGTVDRWLWENRPTLARSAVTLPNSRGHVFGMDLSDDWSKAWDTKTWVTEFGKIRTVAKPHNLVGKDHPKNRLDKIEKVLLDMWDDVMAEIRQYQTRGNIPGDIIVDTTAAQVQCTIPEVDRLLRRPNVPPAVRKTRAELVVTNFRSYQMMEVGRQLYLTKDNGYVDFDMYTNEIWDLVYETSVNPAVVPSILDTIEYTLVDTARGLKLQHIGGHIKRTKASKAAWLLALAVIDSTVPRGPRGAQYYSDQLVTNRRLARDYIAALRFFGLAKDPEYIEVEED